jgi:hypothetical protein
MSQLLEILVSRQLLIHPLEVLQDCLVKYALYGNIGEDNINKRCLLNITQVNGDFMKNLFLGILVLASANCFADTIIIENPVLDEIAVRATKKLASKVCENAGKDHLVGYQSSQLSYKECLARKLCTIYDISYITRYSDSAKSYHWRRSPTEYPFYNQKILTSVECK